MNNQATQAVSAPVQQLTQGQAVIQAIRDVLKSEFKEGTKVVLSDDQRKLVRDVHALYFGLELNDQSLVPGENPRLGKIKFKDWVKAQVKAAVPA